MLISKSDMQDFYKLKKRIKVEKRKQMLCLALVFIGLVCSIFTIQLTTVFLVLAFLILLEITFSGTANQAVESCEKLMATEPEIIKLKSELV